MKQVQDSEKSAMAVQLALV